MHMGADNAKREPPRLAVKYWPEFQGKQMLMSNFFTKRGADAPPPPAPIAPPNGMSSLANAFDSLNAQPQPVFVEEQSAPKAPQLSPSSQPEMEPSSQSSISPPSTQTSLKLSQESSHESLKRPRTGISMIAGGSKPKKVKAGQSKLSSFFTKPTATLTTAPPTAPANASAPSDRACSLSSEIIDLCDDSEEMDMQSPSMSLPTITSKIRLPADKDNGSTTSSQSRDKKNENGKTGSAASSWSAVFMPKPPPPLCLVHQEPAKEFRVNKPGPNKGKKFTSVRGRSGLGMIKAVMRDDEKKSTTSTNAISSCGPAMLSAMLCELQLPLLPLVWRMQRVKGRRVVRL